MMSKKYMLACGDSFTDPNFESLSYPDYDTSYPKWPDLLAKKMKIKKVVNLGRCGVDNNYVFNTAIDHLLANPDKVEIVVVGTTEAWRFNVYNRHFINPISQTTKNIETAEHYQAIQPYVDHIIEWARSPKQGEWFVRVVLKNFIDNILRLQRLCDQLGIRLVMSNILGPYSWAGMEKAQQLKDETLPYSRERVAELIMHVEGFYDVDPKRFCGWPCFPQIGGFAPTDLNIGFVNETMTVGPNDGHPNKIGHEYIAEKMHEHIQKNNI
jgi:hypothetical protein